MDIENFTFEDARMKMWTVQELGMNVDYSATVWICQTNVLSQLDCLLGQCLCIHGFEEHGNVKQKDSLWHLFKGSPEGEYPRRQSNLRELAAKSRLTRCLSDCSL